MIFDNHDGDNQKWKLIKGDDLGIDRVVQDGTYQLVSKATEDVISVKSGFSEVKGDLQMSKKSISNTDYQVFDIKYGDDEISAEKINECLKVAQATFVYDLDGGLNYQIAQGGTNVSGGQRQRLCIARAIAKNPEIYIFDDSF